MDFKTLVNRDGFKALLLHHLKSKVKTKFFKTLSTKIQDHYQDDKFIFSDDIISSISEDILDSPEIMPFVASYLESIDKLLEDKDQYIPKYDKPGSSSLCSSASSVNNSSIDFLSPERFQFVAQSLTTGTNAEKLEALGTLYRLPTLEPIVVHWNDLEKGLFEAISSKILLLEDQTLCFYIKMLTCAEPKVVQESYLSLTKYLLEIAIPRLHEIESYCNDCTIAIVMVLCKFLQNISTHWLRYPQSVIEKITTQSVRVISACQIDNDKRCFNVWTCLAGIDLEAKYLKSLLHGHTSRAAFLSALKENLDVLLFAVRECELLFLAVCDQFSKTTCCNATCISEFIHTVCFLSHFLQHSEGRQVLSCNSSGILSSWTNVLALVMNCVYKVCEIACFNCCFLICDNVSKKWVYFWDVEDNSLNDSIAQLLTPNLNGDSSMSTTALYFATECFCHCFERINNTIQSLESEKEISCSILNLLNYSIQFFDSDRLRDIELEAIHLLNSSLVLLKCVLSTHSQLFFKPQFIQVLSKWVHIIKEVNSSKTVSLCNDSAAKLETKTLTEVDKNILEFFISMLKKPCGSVICYHSSIYEKSLNILLEKLIKDIKFRKSVCLYDILTLVTSLNQSVCAKSVLNKTTMFRLSSLIWKLNTSDDDMSGITQFFLNLVPSIFCKIPITKVDGIDDTPNSEDSLLKHVLLLPNSNSSVDLQEEYKELALIIMSHLSTSIQSLCVLESEFGISEWLLKTQIEFMKIDEKGIICPVTILLNYVLVKFHSLGGPNEKFLPFETLKNVNNSYDWPLVTELPLPEIFCPSITSIPDIDLEDFHEKLQSMSLKDIFLSYLQSKNGIPYNLISEILKTSSDFPQLDSLKCSYSFRSTDLGEADLVLHNTELVGLGLVKSYGKKLNLMKHSDEETLERLLKAVKKYIGAENSQWLDMFVCTVYLLFKSDVNLSWSFLKHFAMTENAFCTWWELQTSLCDDSSNDCGYLQSAIFELCDFITKKSLPEVFSALGFQGILPSSIFSSWTQQCYWNYLDFSEIANFVLINVLFSSEFAIYFFVSVMRHMQGFILQHAHDCDLFSELLKNTINDFKLCDHIDFICKLSVTFHDLTSKSLSDMFKIKTMPS